MLTKSIFKAYDVRGIYPRDVNRHSVRLIAMTLGDMFAQGEIIIAHDGRHGSLELAKVVKDTIISHGGKQGKKFKIVFVGLATTPMFYFLVNHLKAQGGAMITASHNPKEYNGVKPVSQNALPISGTELLAHIEKMNYGL